MRAFLSLPCRSLAIRPNGGAPPAFLGFHEGTGPSGSGAHTGLPLDCKAAVAEDVVGEGAAIIAWTAVHASASPAVLRSRPTARRMSLYICECVALACQRMGRKGAQDAVIADWIARFRPSVPPVGGGARGGGES